jgi:hypothetical protein
LPPREICADFLHVRATSAQHALSDNEKNAPSSQRASNLIRLTNSICLFDWFIAND